MSYIKIIPYLIADFNIQITEFILLLEVTVPGFLYAD